jgi:hypothetical protein
MEDPAEMPSPGGRMLATVSGRLRRLQVGEPWLNVAPCWRSAGLRLNDATAIGRQ